MTLTLVPAKLSGTVVPPPSKSQAHRVLIAAALAQGESVISNVALSQDIQATLGCLQELGAEFSIDGSTVTVQGMGATAMSPLRRMALPRLDCGESGSTLRFLIPIALAVRGGGIFTGRGRLMERPLAPYERLFREKGIVWEQQDGVLTVQGLLTPGEYALAGNVSSQFFTGLLFALPLLDGPSALLPTTFLESEGYISMTLEAMARFGVELAATLSLPPQWHAQGRQTYVPQRVAVEADWSQAGFWYAAQVLGNPVAVAGLDPDSAQPDRVVAQFARQLTGGKAAGTGWEDGGKTGGRRGEDGGTELDVSGCPDLVPPLAAMAALCPGRETRLVNAGRLRAKESDRLSAVTQVLTALGAEVAEGADFLRIRGRETLPGGVTVDSCNDHRIAMMTAILATRCQRPVVLTGAGSVAKSYPDFWEEYRRLGGQAL